MYQVEVLLEHGPLINSFSYLSHKELPLYVRVKVPLKGKVTVGLVVACSIMTETEYQLLQVIECLDEKAILNEELQKLGKWMSEYYLTSYIKVIQTILPSAFRPKSSSQKPQMIAYVNYIKDKELKGEKQKTALIYIKELQLVERSVFNRLFPGVLRGFVKENLCEIVYQEKTQMLDDLETEKDLTLSEKQKEIYDILCQQENYIVNLLFGITGSGKSEIYLQLSKYWTKQEKQVLILVPEIGLTPQMIKLFKSRLGDNIAIYHSRLSNQERYQQYQLVKQKKVRIVVGTRSAVFLPFDNLACIVIDEEHDDSYKQDNMPKYHTRDIALWRAKYHNCQVVLASATPALESYARGLKGNYNLLTLNQRVNGELPEVVLVDMNQQYRSQGNTIISQDLANSIKVTLEKNQQVIILLNRRGYTPIVKCQSCQTVIQCDYCDIAMVYHKDEKLLKCHTCGASKVYPKFCNKCSSTNFLSLGYGTEKLEEEIVKLFPSAKVLRMDKDTTANKNSYQEILSKFSQHKADILLGTQMIAKGLDFPEVTLVGILNGDALLNRVDYKAQETTFSLLMQAAGRAGRQVKKSKVIIQAYQINHYALKWAKQHNYQAFFNQEMKYRKLAGYPPYQYLILITLSLSDESKSSIVINQIKNDLIDRGLNVLGPSKLLKRLNTQPERLTIKGKDLDLMQREISKVLINYQKYPLVIDVNPTHTEI